MSDHAHKLRDVAEALRRGTFRYYDLEWIERAADRLDELEGMEARRRQDGADAIERLIGGLSRPIDVKATLIEINGRKTLGG